MSTLAFLMMQQSDSGNAAGNAAAAGVFGALGLVWLAVVLLLFLIPFVNLVVGFIVVFDTAKAFGKGAGFALGMIFLGPIFYPVLAWSDAKYQGVPVRA